MYTPGKVIFSMIHAKKWNTITAITANKIFWKIPASYTPAVGSMSRSNEGLMYQMRIANGSVKSSCQFFKKFKMEFFMFIRLVGLVRSDNLRQICKDARIFLMQLQVS